MLEKALEFFKKVNYEQQYHDLQTHIDMIESGGVQKWISLMNLKFKYMFRSSDEILEMLREDKTELEELDYIG